MLDTLYQKYVSLYPTDEAETGSGGNQPARNNLSYLNGQGTVKCSQFSLIIPRVNALENSLPQQDNLVPTVRRSLNFYKLYV
jgi:hypothetical protein